MPKKLNAENLLREKRNGRAFPGRGLSAGRAAARRTVHEDIEARQGRDAIENPVSPDILMTSSAIWTKRARDPRFVVWLPRISAADARSAALADNRADDGCLRCLPRWKTVREETSDRMNMLSRGQRAAAERGPGERGPLAHSSEPNPRRRIPFCLPCARPAPDAALPARGEDRRGHWRPDPERGPACLDRYHALSAGRADRKTRSEAAHGTAG